MARSPRDVREPVSHVDATWLRMDTPTSPMVIHALVTYRVRVHFDDFMQVVRDRLLRHARFRQRAVHRPMQGWQWEVDPHFDVRNHVHRLALPSPGDRAALEAFMSDLMGTPLPRDRPLWQLYVVEGFDGGTALAARIHHAVGDGVSLVGVLLDLTEEGAALAPQQVGVPPVPTPASWRDRARLLKAQATTLGHILRLPADPPTPLRQGGLGMRKRAVWSRAMPLPPIKQTARRLGVKLNDVLVGVLAGTLRAHLEAVGGWSTGVEVRAMMPVFIWGHMAPGQLGNHFGLVFVSLPLAVGDPVGRVLEAKARLDAIKASPEATLAQAIIGLIGVASPQVEQLFVDLFTRKASVLVTNVPGPRSPLHLAGGEVDGLMVWAPPSGHLGVSVSMLSYADALRVGIACDERRVPDPRGLVETFEAELARVVAS
jgi:diacylglycerol O-acyltransferase / wax synthase